MEEQRQIILNNITQIKDVVNTLRKPKDNDYSNAINFLMDAKLLTNLEKLTNMVTTSDELIIIADITVDLINTIKYKIIS